MWCKDIVGGRRVVLQRGEGIDQAIQIKVLRVRVWVKMALKSQFREHGCENFQPQIFLVAQSLCASLDDS